MKCAIILVRFQRFDTGTEDIIQAIRKSIRFYSTIYRMKYFVDKFMDGYPGIAVLINITLRHFFYNYRFKKLSTKNGIFTLSDDSRHMRLVLATELVS